jgi:hypothetical protein
MISALGRQRLGWADMTLVFIFFMGIYLSINLQISSKIPLPSVISGFAGFLLLWRRREQWHPHHIMALMGVVVLYLGSILAAPDFHFLGKRFTGLVQLTYSLVICYALFATIIEADRNQMAKLFLGFCITIVIGCLLEQHAGLRPISDAFRNKVYDGSGVYDADLRDLLLYGRVRPKLFTSEPSAVTFSYTFFAFCWYMFSAWRWKIVGYLGLLGIGLLAMPGPTLMLMLILIIPYEVFLGGRNRAPGLDILRLMKVGVMALFFLAAFVGIGKAVYSARLADLSGGKDGSFFFRQTGPALVALEMAKKYPMTGIGLTGEPFIKEEVIDIYLNSPQFNYQWRIPTRTSEALTNYFWLHWIYLGVGCGLLTLIGLSLWLRVMGVPSVLFCWSTWVILGQAAGAYVGPRTWLILLVPAAAAVLHRQVVRRPVAELEAEEADAQPAPVSRRLRLAAARR